MPPELYTILRPTCPAIPVVATISHSGGYVPPEILQTMLLHPDLGVVSDPHVDTLFDFLTKLGVTVLVANYSRLVVDLNCTDQYLHNDRRRSVVRQTDLYGKPLYSAPLHPAEIQHRLNKYYYPFYGALDTLIAEASQQTGKVLVLDLHCFQQPRNLPHDIDIGTLDGRSCAAQSLPYKLLSTLANAEFLPSLNKTYKGGNITYHASKNLQAYAMLIEVFKERYGVDKADIVDVALFAQTREKLHIAFTELLTSPELARALRRTLPPSLEHSR